MNKKAQITLEACLIIVVVVAGWLAMRGFFTRAIQAKWKGNADSFSDGGQYCPDNSTEYGRGAGAVPGEIRIINPKISVDIERNHGELHPASDTTSGVIQPDKIQPDKADSKVLHIQGWGTYR